MTIQRLPGYVEIDISTKTIDTTKVQARQTNIKKNIADLALSIETQGLFSPILVVDYGEQVEPTKPRYELIAGQRRTLAHREHLVKKDPEKYGKIGAFCYAPSMEEWEKKAISINENFNQEPMSEEDRISSVTACFNQFDSISITSTKTGISLERVRKYVKYDRLPACLKKLKDDGVITLQTALETANLFKIDTAMLPDGVIEQDVIDCAKEQQRLSSKQKKRVKDEVEKDPKTPIGIIIDKVKTHKETRRPITIEVISDTYARVETFKDKNKMTSVGLAAEQLVEDGLDKNDM